jgi:DNA-binding CsgD family transcriptional regulator
MLLVRDLPNQKEQIGILNGAGYAPADIANMLGTTAHTVSVALSEIKKAKGQKRGSRPKK